MYITINNHNIYYQKVGKGKDLILLHGYGQDVSTWWGIVEKLSDEFTLWLLDLPGFGRSEKPKKTFTVSDYAEVVEEFIKQNKIKSPHLLGHSLGGRVSIKLAKINPELINKLILEDTAGVKPQKNLTQILAYPLAKLGKVLVPNIFNLREKLKTKLYQGLESDYLSAEGMKETFLNVINEDLTPDLEKIKNETLIIWGEKDRVVPLNFGKKIYKLIKNSRLEVIDNVGHFPHLENPDGFVYWVRNFLI